MERPLSGRVAFVTGSGRGIGAAIAASLAERGAAVVLHGRSAPHAVAAELAAAHGVETLALGADLAEPDAVASLFEAFDARFGRLDILVNNAGFERTDAAEAMAEADWRSQLDINLTVPFLLAQQAARRMQRRGAGVIVNITSIHSTVARKGLAAYAVAKAGLTMLTKCLALEWAEYGIRVVAVAPGAIETDMNREAIAHFGRDRFEGWIPAGRLGHVDDVAAAVAFLASDAASYATGIELTLDGGYALNLVRYDDRPGR